MLTDTHAHLHHKGLVDRLDEVMASAARAGVSKMVCVGVAEADSREAVAIAERFSNVWATVGLHPHDAEFDHAQTAIKTLKELVANPKVVAIGECGLDYSRDATGRAKQEAVFRQQIELAMEMKLPMVWHVRDAFDDFFEIVDDYPGLSGIVHCFTSNHHNLDQALSRGFLVALNGIMTFTKDPAQLEVAKAVPPKSLVLETDCPFLAPVPKRGQTNEPAYLRHTAEFLAELRGETLEDLAAATSQNAAKLLGLDHD